jgi:heme exporter protein D
MSALGPHSDFIVAAYVAAATIIAALIIWVAVDYRTQNALLTDLNKAGAKRRSQS